VRLQLELLKPEMILTEAGIRSTVVMFGGARIPEPGKAPWAAKNETQAENLTAAARYYDEARELRPALLNPFAGHQGAGIRDRHRRRTGRDGGGQPRRPRCRRSLDRPQCGLAARAGTQ
jgi:hypothetical protein